jgi:hypothetical protein
MKRALVLVVLLACGTLAGCAAAIIGGGSGDKCEQRDSRDCPK